MQFDGHVGHDARQATGARSRASTSDLLPPTRSSIRKSSSLSSTLGSSLLAAPLARSVENAEMAARMLTAFMARTAPSQLICKLRPASSHALIDPFRSICRCAFT